MTDQKKTDGTRHWWILFGAMFIAFSVIALLYSTLFPQVMNKYEQDKRRAKCNPQFHALLECNSRYSEKTVKTPLDNWFARPQPDLINPQCSNLGVEFAQCWEGATKQ
jgi:hypothetical protein